MSRLIAAVSAILAIGLFSLEAHAVEGAPDSGKSKDDDSQPLEQKKGEPKAEEEKAAEQRLPSSLAAKEVHARLEVLQSVVSAQSAHERDYRWGGGVSELAVGATLLPSGIVLYSRHGSALTGGMIGLGGAGVLGGLGTLVLGGEQHVEVERAMDEARARGRDEAAVLAAGEKSLREAAESARLERRVGGFVSLGLGVLALGTGVAFVSADFTGRGFDREQQDGVAMALLLGGAASTTDGLRSLLLPSAIENTWTTYALCGHSEANKQALVSNFSLRMAPVPGGAGIGVGGAF